MTEATGQESETPTPTRRWFGIHAASDRLGVNQSTLRRWSDEGKIPVFLTPGGHRRYAEDDLLAFAQGSRRLTSETLTQASLSHYRSDQYVTDVRRRPWYGEYDDATVAAHRARGLAMVRLAVRYVAAKADERERGEILAEACEVAAEYGRDSAQHGLGITDAAQMYLRARTPILQGVIQFLEADASSTTRTGRIFADVSDFMDRTLVAMIAQYEREGARSE